MQGQNLPRPSRRSFHRSASKTDGAVLVGVLACLLIGSILVGLLLQSALRGRREARRQRQLAQTQWLCEAGLIRAFAALEKSSDYTGETWQPKLNIPPLIDASIEIKVEKPAAGATENATSQSSWKVTVTAHLDSTSDIDGPMQRTETLTIKSSSADNSQSE